MSQTNRLIGATDIIAASWRNLAENIRLYLEFTAWSTAIGLLLWLAALAVRHTVTDRLAAKMTMAMVSLPFSLFFMVIALALIQATWKCLGKGKMTLTEAMAAGAHNLVSFIWLSFLTGLFLLAAPAAVLTLGYSIATAAGPILGQHFWLYVVAIAVLAALAGTALMIPAYFFLPVSFNANFLQIDGLKGWACLKRCTQLIRGRWWQTFWRLAVPGIFFWLAGQFVLKLAYLLLGSIFGDPGTFFGIGAGSDTVLRETVVLVMAEIVYGLSAPLFVGANLIVWNDLKRLEEKE